MRRPTRAILLLLSATLVTGPRPARAEETGEIRWSFSGEARFRPEWRDNADLNDALDDDTRQGFMRVRLGVRAAVRDDYAIFIQVQDSRVAGEEASPSPTTSNQRNLDLHQGYATAGFGAKKSFLLTLGRQEWAYGDHRMIGNFSWNNVGRAFDGVKLRWTRERFFLDGFFASISDRPEGTGGNTGSALYGLYAQAAPRKGAEYEAYYLGFADNGAAAGERLAPGRTSINAVGARAKDRFGRLDVVAEAVIERGKFNGDDLAAHAAAAQAGLTWGSGAKVRVFGGYDFATGDENPADGKRQEFFNFFPTNHPHYGLMDYEGWRNIKSPYGGVSVTRGRHLAQAKMHHFDLEEARGPWKDATGTVLGSDPAGTSGTSVGREVDLTYRFAWKEKASMEAGLARFDPGRFAKLRRGSDSSAWGYFMVTFGF